MLANLASYFTSHPTITSKETCKACFAHLQAKKDDIRRDTTLKTSQKQAELLKKDGQSERSQLRTVAYHSLMCCMLRPVKRMYWKTGTKAERIRHLANCAHQTRRTREEAQLERNKKASSETPSAQDESPGPMEHFKGAREKARTQRRNTRPARASSSKSTSHREDTDDEAFEEMIATGEHAQYLADLKLEQERAERRKKREELEAKKRAEQEISEDERPECVSSTYHLVIAILTRSPRTSPFCLKLLCILCPVAKCLASVSIGGSLLATSKRKKRTPK